MKIYHTATREDYYSLMIELEDKGVTWSKGSKPTTINNWQSLESNTCISLENGIIEYSDTSYYNRRFPSIEIVEYKAKGEEIKHRLQATAFDVSVAIESFAKGLSEVESDLQEAKSSAKKLIEKLEDYLESLKPKFKVGDYVVEQNGTVISKIEEVLNCDFWGAYYRRIDNHFCNTGSTIFALDIERHATPEEIAEYEAALTFHEHGRDPFEVKYGDILGGSECAEFFVDYDDSDTLETEDFISGRYTLLKTVEEFKEWVGAEDE